MAAWGRGLGIGAVLIVALAAGIESRLFSRIEPARAQSSPHLSINLNDVEVRVVKTDNTSSTNPGFGVVDSKSTAAYFNKIKVTNSSNQTVYFRLTGTLHIGPTWSQCASPGCGGGAYLVVGPGQTYSVPDNTVGMGNIISLNTSSNGSAFQSLALQGFNTAKLKVSVQESTGGASGTAERDAVLKWSAVRAKLLNSSNNPMANVILKLFRPGASVADAWHGGLTNAQGLVSMALLDPTPVTYTAKYFNTNSNIALSPPVEVTGPDFQDLVFLTSCGSTGGGGGTGFFFGRTKAQSQTCLPDLIPIVSDVQVVVTDGNSVEHTARPANFGSEIKKVVIKNMKVKNVGGASAIGQLNYTLKVSDISEISETPFAINLTPNSTVTLPDLVIDDNVFQTLAYLKMGAGSVAETGSTTLSPTLILDPKNPIIGVDVFDESNEDNNQTAISNMLQFPAIKVLVTKTNSSEPIPLARIDFTETDTHKKVSSVTDSNGIAWLAPARSLYAPATYEVKATLGGISLGPAKTVAVSQNIIYSESFNTAGWLIIAPQLYRYEGSADDPIRPTSGLLEIKKSGTDISLLARVKDGVAAFSAQGHPELVTGQYELVSATPNYQFTINKQVKPFTNGLEYNSFFQDFTEDVRYVWPEKTSTSPDQDPKNPPKFSYVTDGVSSASFINRLRKECQTLTTVTHEICWEDDEYHIRQGQEKILPIVEREIKRFKSWSQFPGPSQFNQIRMVAGEIDDWIGLYNYASYISMKNRFELLSTAENIQNTVDHEMFHFIDEYYEPSWPDGTFLSNRPDYLARLQTQLQSDIGLKLWDLAIYNCAYIKTGICEGGYPSGPELNSNEALAEEKSTVCTYKQVVLDRLANIETYWEQKVGPLSADDRQKLREQRDNVLMRMVGKNQQGNVTIPEIQAWQSQCLNTK